MIRAHVPLDKLTPAPNHFNPGLIDHAGALRFVYRTEEGNDSVHNYLCELDAQDKPTGPHRRISFPDTNRREDLRLFVHHGELHASYTIYPGCGISKQRYSRLALDGSTANEHAPVFRPDEYEKNWQFFSHAGDLYAIYRITPRHVVFLLDGGKIHTEYHAENQIEWPFGEPRGGTPPILVGEEYWSLFHSHLWNADRRVYFVGAYAFQARPPFKLTRYTRAPIMVPGAKRHALAGARELWQSILNYVVFPCGWILRGDRFLVSYGHNDLEACLTEIPRDAIDGAML